MITEKFEQEKGDIIGRYVFNFPSLFYRLTEYSYRFFSRFLIVFSVFNFWPCNYLPKFVSSWCLDFACELNENLPKFASSFYLFCVKLFGSSMYYFFSKNKSRCRSRRENLDPGQHPDFSESNSRIWKFLVILRHGDIIMWISRLRVLHTRELDFALGIMHYISE